MVSGLRRGKKKKKKRVLGWSISSVVDGYTYPRGTKGYELDGEDRSRGLSMGCMYLWMVELLVGVSAHWSLETRDG